MALYSTLASIFTVISFLVFAGIVAWALSARRKAAFDAAAIEPFALPDEAAPFYSVGLSRERNGHDSRAVAEGARS